MNKQYMVIVLLLIVCAILSLSLLNSNSNAIGNECLNGNSNKDKTSINTDFDALNYMDSFDVSDFASTNINTIDIASKKYASNTITVLDSDFKISKELVDKITATINDYGAGVSFYIVSLNDGMSIGYNVDKRFETASSIKAPYALYVYKEIAEGNINPDPEFTYEENY